MALLLLTAKEAKDLADTNSNDVSTVMFRNILADVKRAALCGQYSIISSWSDKTMEDISDTESVLREIGYKVKVEMQEYVRSGGNVTSYDFHVSWN